MCTFTIYFSQVRYEDSQQLTVSLHANWEGQVYNSSHLKSFREYAPSHTHTHNTAQILSKSAPLIPLFPLLIPVKSCHYRKKSNPPISLSRYLSIPPLPWAPDLAQSSSPPAPLSVSALFHYFQDDKKYMTIKSLMPVKARGWPKGDPAIFISLRPTFHPPPLIALTHSGCRSLLTFPDTV